MGATGMSSSGAGSGASSGTAASGVASGAATGIASGSGDGGASSGGDGGSLDLDAGLPAGAVNMVPAGYMGTPFARNPIPGFVYIANYDKGGPGVAFCHTAGGMGAACTAGINIKDWCCSDCNAMMTGARCNDLDQHLGVCPVYRMDAENAGLSHMNLGEVDTFSTAGPTWVPGPNGPTLTGPNVAVGDPVPQHANATTADDTYLSYTKTGQWQKYTVEVLSAGMYSIGGLIGAPGGAGITLDFGNGITSGAIKLPTSPVTAACKCLESFHAWTNMSKLGTVTFAQAGIYVMTFTISGGLSNPLYLTFTKM